MLDINAKINEVSRTIESIKNLRVQKNELNFICMQTFIYWSIFKKH